MINILPPDLKQQIKFSHYNVTLLRYIFLVLLVLAGIAAIAWFSLEQMDTRILSAQSELKQLEEEADPYKDTVAQSQELQQRFNSIEELLSSRSRYSQLLRDLASVMPEGSYLTSISLTGEEKTPLSLSATVPEYGDAAVLRDSLESSERLEFVDIQTITQSEQGEEEDASAEVNVELVAGFAEGQAR